MTRQDSEKASRAAPRGQQKSGLLIDDAADNDTALYAPSARAAFQYIMIARMVSAWVSIIPDCDETYNYWEPLHQLLYPPDASTQQMGSFKTWEYDPRFRIRSWLYLLQFAPVKWYNNLWGFEKWNSFFFVRAVLGVVSARTEAKFYESTKRVMGRRVARNLLFALLFNAGIFEASTALVPSAYTFYTTTLAWSFALIPAAQADPWKRCRGATISFALGAIVGWPFAIVLAVPFVFEEIIAPFGRLSLQDSGKSFARLTKAALIAGLAIGSPSLIVDTLAYGRTTFVPWNIIAYNLLSKERGAGPELYGSEPVGYYLRTMVLTFNVLLPLAVLSIPTTVLMWLTTKRSERRLSHLFALITRLSPPFLWIALLSSQSHKEERFLYPAYALLCFNAAVGLAQLEGLASKASTVLFTPSLRQRASKLVNMAPWWILTISTSLGLLRSAALVQNYSAPLQIAWPLWSYEAKNILYHAIERNEAPHQNTCALSRKDTLANVAKLPNPTKVCYADEWYRYSTSFLLPQGVQAEFTWSGYPHILPGHFPASSSVSKSMANGNDPFAKFVTRYLGWAWPQVGSTVEQGDYNEFNRREPSHLIHPLECDYIVDLSFPHRDDYYNWEQDLDEDSHESWGPSRGVYNSSTTIPFYAYPHVWSEVKCVPFLDAESSRAGPGASRLDALLAGFSRAFWLPKWIGNTRKWGQFCLRGRIKCPSIDRFTQENVGKESLDARILAEASCFA